MAGPLDEDVITVSLRHELSGVLVRRCEDCRHAAQSHVGGRCTGFPAVDGSGGSDPCGCTTHRGAVEDLGVLGRTPEGS